MTYKPEKQTDEDESANLIKARPIAFQRPHAVRSIPRHGSYFLE